MASEELSPFLDDFNGDETSDETPVSKFPTDSDEGPIFRRPSSRCGCWCIVISVVVTILMIAVVFSAGIAVGHFAISNSRSCADPDSSTGNISQEICADPPLLLISLDGFRASYFHHNVTPNIQDLYLNGVRSEFMRSSFPTKTFPNHYSIVTGLYPEYHGIVGNHFYDSELKDKFDFNKRSSLQSKWWGGEPVWVTAALNHIHTASYFWPGSETVIKGIRPDIYMNYDGSIPFSIRVETVMDWFDQPKDKRPKFVTLYFSQPDSIGHEYGPESSEIIFALTEVDGVIRLLMRELKKRNISDCVNIIIVSDHGMAAYNSSDFINIEELISPDLRKNITYFPRGVISNTVLFGDELIETVYKTFVNGTKAGSPFRVFRRDQMPLRFHAGLYNRQRYGQIYAVADVHGTFGFSSDTPSLGNHGYDNIEKEMQAIFIGHGPYFKKNYVAGGFENVQVYSLLCDLLNITPANNNGSYGALHHFLEPTFAAKLRPSQSMAPMLGTLGQCPFPQDEPELRRRSLCTDCVCRIDHCNVTDEDILMANEYLLNISTSLKDFYSSYHHPWGVPRGGSGEGACLLSQLGYASLYSHTLNIPLWSGYTLDPALVDGDMSVDHWCWRNDPRLPLSGSPNCSTDLWLLNGTNSTYIPAPLLFPMDSSTNISLSLSLLTNVVYMARPFREGIWQLTKSHIRAWFKTYNVPMNVVIGVVLDANRDGTRDPDSGYANKFMGVAIPTHFYVVITRCGVSSKSLRSCGVKDLKVLGLVLQHPKQPGDYVDDEKVLRYSLTSVRDIERATGVDFFPNLSPADQNTLELGLLDELWTTT